MRTPSHLRLLLSAPLLALAALLATAAPGQATPPLRTWSLVGNGAWSAPGNWSPLGVPIGGDSVLVPLALGTHTVTLDLDTPALNSFVLASPTATLDLNGHSLSVGAAGSSAGILLASGASQGFYGALHTLAGSQTSVANGAVLAVYGLWQNDGHAVVHSSAGASPSEWRMNNYETLTGTGDLQLADATNALITSPSSYSLTHGVGHLIHGAGRITLPFINHGTVTADFAPGATLSVEHPSTSNDGTFRAANGAKLMLNSNVDNTGGLILADGGNVELNGGTVTNGLFHTTGSSAIETSANTTIYGAINLVGALNVNSGHVLNYAGGTLADSGTVLVHASGAALSTFRVTNYLTLTGPGALMLNDPALATIDSPSSYTLTHNVGHTIHGTGSITMPLTNHGLVSADQPGQPLSLTNVIGNDGTLQAAGGGILALQGNTISNTGSVLANGGDVQLTNETINGGVVSSTGGNVVSAFVGSSSLNSITTSGTIQVASGALLATAGVITNSGVVQVRPPSGSSTATLRLNNYATYTGGGSIQLTHATQSVFDSPSSYTVTQNAGHTLHGTGMVTLPMTNHGLVNADVSGQPLTVTNVVNNDGTLQATAGGTLVLTGNTVANTGGAIKANGGDVQLNGETVNGGTLSRTGTNVVAITANSTLNTLANTGVVRLNGGTMLTTTGTITNTGNFVVHQPASVGVSTLRLTNYATFTGAGAIQMTDAANSAIDSPSGYILTNAADHTLHGAGQTTLAITNHGLVSADVSGQALAMGNAIINDGTMQAVGGGTLQLGGVTLTNTGGTLAATAGDVRISGSNIGGGLVTSTGTNAVVFTGSSNVFAGFTNKALAKVNGGVVLTFSAATVTDSGTVQVRAPGDTAAAILRLNNYAALAGNGAVVLTHGTQSIIDSPSGYTLTNVAPHTIRGAGVINCALTNQGTVAGDRQDSTLWVTSASLSLTGIQAAANGGTLAFATNTPNYATNTLTGGTWQAGANSSIQFPSADIRHLASTVVLDGVGSDLVSADSSVSALRRFYAVDLGGSLIVRNGRALNTWLNLPSSGVVGVGPRSLIWVNGGLLGSYQMDTSATFLVELDGHGATGCGKLSVLGLAAITGHLKVRVLNGFQPNLADTFEVMNFTTRTGNFTHLDSVLVAPHIVLVPLWQANRLLLVAQTTYGTTDTPPTPGATLPQALSFSARVGAGGPARLELSLPHAAQVDVSVFDVSGRLVTSLARDTFAAGRWSWTWNAAREQAASGMYFARARVTTDGATRDLTSRLVVWH